MTAVRHSLVILLALLLAAATAAADTVVTANEVIDCLVVWSDANFTRLKLPSGGVRMLYTRDIREMRLSDPSRTIEPPPRPPQVTPSPDSAQPDPPPSVDGTDLLGYAGILDTLAVGASVDDMKARCWEMNAALRECGRSDDAIDRLLREVKLEAAVLGRIWPPRRTRLCIAGGGGVGGCIGFWIGEAIRPTGITSDCIGFGPGGHPPSDCDVVEGGGPVGCAVGTVAGYAGGAAVGHWWRATLVARHRGRVNELVRRFNRIVAEP